MLKEEYLKAMTLAANLNVKERDFWLEKLSGEIRKSNFPYDYRHIKNKCTDDQAKRGDTVRLKISGDLFSRLMNLSNESDHILHMIFVAGLNVLIYKYTGCTDIIIGIPIYKQDIETEFVNTVLPLRNRLDHDMTFKGLLMQVKTTVIEAIENYAYPMEILLEQLKISTSSSDNSFPLFDVAILLENIHDKRHIGHINNNITFFFLRTDRFIEGRVEYNPLLYNNSTIQRIIDQLTNLLQVGLSNLEKRLSALDIMPGEERRKLLFELSGADEDYPGEKTIHQLFQEQVKKTPDHTVVVLEDKHLTYKVLNEKSNQLARWLRRKGIAANNIIGLMMDNSLEMIIGILGILKAGGAYLPVGVDLPKNRFMAMLRDSKVSLLLTRDELLKKIKFVTLRDFESGSLKKIVTCKRSQVMDLDSLQVPDRSLVDYQKYHPFIGQSMVKNSITLQYSRGCVFKCLYCFKIWPDKYALRSGENLFEEVNMYYKMGIRRFGFTDDLPNFNKKEIGKFYRLVIKNKLKIHMHFPNGIRGDVLTPDFIDLLVEAGAVTMDLALETASPRLQKLIRKNVNIDRLRRNVEYIIEKYPNVILGVQVMHGFPTETEEEAKASLEFIKSFRWLPFGYMHILKIYPNTDMARFAQEHGISKEDIIRSVDLAYHELPYTLPFPESFTRQCQSEYLGEFFLLKERLLKVLPHQMSMLTEDELVQKYNSYLPVDIHTFSELLDYIGIPRTDVKGKFLPENFGKVENFNEKVRQYFPVHKSSIHSTRLLLLDLSQHFTHESNEMYHVIDPPLGLIYLLTHLNKTFGPRLQGKIAKSQVDFDGYDELRELIEDFKPHIIGIRTLTYFKNFFHKAISLIRQWGVTAPIIAGGPYATSSYDTMLQDINIDLAVLGEGEITMAEVMTAVMNNNGRLPDESILMKIPGIAFLGNKEKKQQKRLDYEIMLIDQMKETLSKESYQDLEPVNRSGELAYVIYTSGSTGIPKGVMVLHQNVVNQITGLQRRFEPGHRINYLILAAFTFDVSVMHMFWAATTGAKFFVIKEETKKDPLKLWQFIYEKNINLLNIVPAFMKAILENIEKKKIHFKYLFIGGDVFDPELYKKLTETFETENIINIYGPTETTINAALYLCTDIDMDQPVPIGKSVMNYKAYILDRNFELVPIGGSGELCIGGKGVARGYLNRPELTAKRFISNPLGEGRLYLTGDQARWRPDGNLQFLGRMDQQVKVRGFRIELGEIERHLLGCKNIKEALVMVKKDLEGEKYLTAYIIPHHLTHEKKISISELKKYLSQQLPHYMIPSYFIILERIPLTSNGKVDRKQLPEFNAESEGEFAPPRNEIEKRISALFAKILGIEENKIGINSNFFDLGGHSLKATILISRIHKELNCKIPLGQLFEMPTIKGLSMHIKEKKQHQFNSITAAEKKEYYVLSPAQKRLHFLQQMEPTSTAYNSPSFIVVEGKIDKERLERAFRELIHRHEILRTSIQVWEGTPVQRIYERLPFKIYYYNLANQEQNTGVREKEIMENFVRPFNMEEVPLLRVGLVEKDDYTHILMVDMFHVVTDAMSDAIFLKDLIALYNGEELPGLKIQYKDFSQWQNKVMKKERMKEQEAYWLGEFAGEIPALNIASDFKRPPVKSVEGRTLYFDIPAGETRALKKIAQEEEVTLYMVLLALFNVLCYKLSGQEDIVVGTATAGRWHADLEQVMGMFANTLALRNQPRETKTFKEFLITVKEKTLKAFENQDYQFADLVEKLAVRSDINRHPLFDVGFGLQHQQPQEVTIPGLKFKPYEYENKTAKFDLSFAGTEKDGKVSFLVEYWTKLFRNETVEKYFGYFREIITAVIENRNIKLKDIKISYDHLFEQKINNPQIKFSF
ncbi:MAG: amino acid adenylation domain-containing protein [Candidatus Aminicenantes bacterium]|jgi:amino acid adenylation domain-containing protein